VGEKSKDEEGKMKDELGRPGEVAFDLGTWGNRGLLEG